MDIDRYLRELLDATPDAMIAVDEAGTILWVNAQCEKVFGYDRDELVGLSHDVLVPEPWRAVHRHHREHYLTHATVRPMGDGRELEGRRRDGSTFPAEISLSASTAADGTIVLAAVRDVTDRKEAERQLHHAREAAEVAEAANRAKSAFLSRVSHELRTPLNAILGFAQLLERDALTHSQREDVDQIRDAGQHLLGLIDDVLDLSAVESGHPTLALAPVEVLELVDDATSLVTPIARTRNVRIAVHGEPGLQVMADRQRLKQVLLNLLSNAIKYNVTGGRVVVAWGEAGSDRLRIDVSDTGPGITPRQMGRLFRPFDRLGAERSAVQGVGLGLALSKGLVERMAGTLSATSEPGDGATFSIDLPLAAPAVVPRGPGT